MNQTETLFATMLAFATGYFIAYTAKNFGRLWEKLGALLFIIFIPPVIMGALVMAEGIAYSGSLILSLAFGTGFLIRLVKRDD